MEARASGLKNADAIDHALAMLDVRLTLQEQIGRYQYLYTDTAVPYGQTNIRPDNRLVPWGGDKPILFESEHLASVKVSRPRIRRKVANLTAFFLSAEGQAHDRAVRIIYLWSEAKHISALDVWLEACRLERQRGGLARLPFRLVFLPHRLFLEAADPLSLDAYEPRATTPAVPKPAEEPPAAPVVEVENGPLLGLT